ncbi:unnamed protein product, partial [Symbiodinium pilosum]
MRLCNYCLNLRWSYRGPEFSEIQRLFQRMPVEFLASHSQTLARNNCQCKKSRSARLSRPLVRQRSEALEVRHSNAALTGSQTLLALKPPRSAPDAKAPGGLLVKAGTKLPRPEEAPAFVIPRTAEEKLQVEAEAAAFALLRGCGSVQVGHGKESSGNDS